MAGGKMFEVEMPPQHFEQAAMMMQNAVQPNNFSLGSDGSSSDSDDDYGGDHSQQDFNSRYPLISDPFEEDSDEERDPFQFFLGEPSDMEEATLIDIPGAVYLPQKFNNRSHTGQHPIRIKRHMVNKHYSMQSYGYQGSAYESDINQPHFNQLLTNGNQTKYLNSMEDQDLEGDNILLTQSDIDDPIFDQVPTKLKQASPFRKFEVPGKMKVVQ